MNEELNEDRLRPETLNQVRAEGDPLKAQTVPPAPSSDLSMSARAAAANADRQPVYSKVG